MTVYDMVKNILLCACQNVYHRKALKEVEEYIVWNIYGKKSLRADGMQDEAVGRYIIDIYTKAEFSEVPDRLEKLCDMHDDVTIDSPACTYDEQTGYSHYVYTLEVT